MINIDVFKENKIPQPIVTGLVLKVTSPKGKRVFREETQRYHYTLHTDLIQIYDNEPIKLNPGLYWIVAISKVRNPDYDCIDLQWNHYLIKVTEDRAEMLESYLNQYTSDWIVEAMPTIKKYFKTEDLQDS